VTDLLEATDENIATENCSKDLKLEDKIKEEEEVQKS